MTDILCFVKAAFHVCVRTEKFKSSEIYSSTNQPNEYSLNER